MKVKTNYDGFIFQAFLFYFDRLKTYLFPLGLKGKNRTVFHICQSSISFMLR